MPEHDEDSSGGQNNSSSNTNILTTPSTNTCIVPIFCVARPENIVQLMTSTLYQRRVLKIKEPVVGLTFRKSGSLCKFLYGWLDDDEHGDAITPHIVAARSDDVPCATSGVFNLMDLTSALLFANYLLSLKDHSDRIRTSVDIDEGLNKNILQWLASIDEHSSEAGFRPADRFVSLCTTPCIISYSSTVAVKGRCLPPAPIILSFSKRPEEIKSEPAPYVTLILMTNFAKSKGSPRAQEDTLSLSDWLHDMGAFNIARTSISHEQYEEVNNMIKLYDEFTALSWPAAWSGEEQLPNVDQSVLGLRADLFLSIEKTIANTLQAVVERIVPRLSALLYAANNALACHFRSYSRGALESERRFSWDELLYMFCTGKDTHLVPLLERELRMPRTKALDCARQSVEAWRTFRLTGACQLEEICHSALVAIVSKKAVPHSLEFIQTSNALQLEHDEVSRLDALGNTLRTSKESSDSIIDDVWRRHSIYPQTAKCDAVVAISMPGFLQEVKKILEEQNGAAFAKNFAFIQHPTADMDEGFQPDDTSKSKSKMYTQRHVLDSPVVTTGQVRAFELVHDLFRLASLDAADLSDHNLAGERDAVAQPLNKGVDSDLLLPVLLVEYKKKDTDGFQAANQHRLYSCSAVRFVQAVGITDFPVFSLITRGSVGLLFMTWYSGKDEHIYVMERIMNGFNISTPRGAFRYSQFLSRLNEHGKKLESLYNAALPKFLERLKREGAASPSIAWTKFAQDAEIRTGDNPVTLFEK
ncbi:hypothetical protein B0H21DRAFT_813624 [Amylocystis lapponica]|nr:hypothetical protein B0H21DRAFT_813624 [Amylocystis lapponica]